jgi:hypothetical protein
MDRSRWPSSASASPRLSWTFQESGCSRTFFSKTATASRFFFRPRSQ